MAVPVGVKVGDVLTSVAEVGNNIGEFYSAGVDFVVHAVDGEEYLSLEPVAEVIEGDECGIWFYFFVGGAPDNTDCFVIKH